MRRWSCWFVLLCACHSTASVPAGEPASETAGSDVPTESVDTSDDPIVQGTDALLYLAETLDAHQAYAESQQEREAYGDGEDCEGVCGLSTRSVPEPEPLDAEMELEILADSLEQMAGAAQTRPGEHWTALATRFREIAAAAQVEGEPLGRLDEAVRGALAAVEETTASGAASAELCWLGTRVVASNVNSLYAAFESAISELNLQMQIDAGMVDESEADEAMAATEQELDALSAVADRASTLIDRTSALLAEGPAQASVVVPELEQLASIIEPALGARRSAELRAATNLLPTICAAPAALAPH